MTRLFGLILCFFDQLYSQRVEFWERIDLNNTQRVNYMEFFKPYDLLAKNITTLLNIKKKEILKVDVLDGKTFFIISRANTNLPLDIGIIYISRPELDICNFDLSFKVNSPKSPDVISGKIFNQFIDSFNKINIKYCSKTISTPSKNSRGASP